MESVPKLRPSRQPGLQPVKLFLHPRHQETGQWAPFPSAEIYSLRFLSSLASNYFGGEAPVPVEFLGHEGLRVGNFTLPLLFKQVALFPAGIQALLVSADAIQTRILVPYDVLQASLANGSLPEEFHHLHWWLLLLDKESDPQEVLKVLNAAGCMSPTSSPVDNGWKVHSRLKRGAFSTLQLCINSNPKESAQVIKVFHGPREDPNFLPRPLCRELSLLLQVQGHPYVVSAISVFCTSMDGILLSWGIAFDYYGSETLFSLAVKRTFPEEEAAVLFQGLSSGIEFIHSKGVVHRDVRPQNIYVVSSAKAVLGDFRLACNVKETGKLTQQVGTASFTAPEVSKGGAYNEKVDVFSFGTVVYFSVLGHVPPLPVDKAEDQPQRSAFIFDADDEDEDLNEMSEDFQELVRLLRQSDPSLRPTSREARMLSWIRGKPLLVSEPASGGFAPANPFPQRDRQVLESLARSRSRAASRRAAKRSNESLASRMLSSESIDSFTPPFEALALTSPRLRLPSNESVATGFLSSRLLSSESMTPRALSSGSSAPRVPSSESMTPRAWAQAPRFLRRGHTLPAEVLGATSEEEGLPRVASETVRPLELRETQATISSGVPSPRAQQDAGNYTPRKLTFAPAEEIEAGPVLTPKGEGLKLPLLPRTEEQEPDLAGAGSPARKRSKGRSLPLRPAASDELQELPQAESSSKPSKSCSKASAVLSAGSDSADCSAKPSRPQSRHKKTSVLLGGASPMAPQPPAAPSPVARIRSRAFRGFSSEAL